MSVSTWISHAAGRAAGHAAGRAAGRAANPPDGLPRPDPTAFDGSGYSADALGLDRRYRPAVYLSLEGELIPLRRTMRPITPSFAPSNVVDEPQSHTAPAA